MLKYDSIVNKFYSVESPTKWRPRNNVSARVWQSLVPMIADAPTDERR
jgi:hypothetical protein